MNLRLERITKCYGSHCPIKDLSIELPLNQTTAILGPSGCGKTTLFRLIAGIEKPDSGKIYGTENLRLSAVFQENRLIESFTLLTNLQFVCHPYAKESEISQALEYFQLQDFAHQKITALSGGMKRRVAILRGLLSPFDLLLLDEPFKELDAKLKCSVMDFVKHKLQHKTALLITHDSTEADFLCHHRIDLSHHKNPINAPD